MDQLPADVEPTRHFVQSERVSERGEDPRLAGRSDGLLELTTVSCCVEVGHVGV